MCYIENVALPFANPLIETAGYRMMTKEFWKITEVVEWFQIDRGFLDDLEEEEIICPTCRDDSEEKLLSSGDLEKLRLARLLFEEMDVNMPGIEVILQMRQNMLDMRKQFDDILEDLASRLQDRFKRSL
jgi:MerR family transcriptional regulator/heat shock protein HspR